MKWEGEQCGKDHLTYNSSTKKALQSNTKTLKELLWTKHTTLK